MKVVNKCMGICSVPTHPIVHSSNIWPRARQQVMKLYNKTFGVCIESVCNASRYKEATMCEQMKQIHINTMKQATYSYRGGPDNSMTLGTAVHNLQT